MWDRIYDALESLGGHLNIEGFEDYITALLVFLFFLMVSKVMFRLLVRMLLFFTHKTKTDYDTKVVKAFQGPASWFIISLGAYLALRILIGDADYFEFVHQLYRSLIIVFLTAGFYNLVSDSSEFLIDISNKFDFDRILLTFLSRALRFIFIAIAATIIAQEWGYDVNGFLAGLGIGGLAFALAAQDSIANVFGAW